MSLQKTETLFFCFSLHEKKKIQKKQEKWTVHISDFIFWFGLVGLGWLVGWSLGLCRVFCLLYVHLIVCFVRLSVCMYIENFEGYKAHTLNTDVLVFP